MRVLVLADTHLKVPVEDRFPQRLLHELELSDLTLHAGDVTSRTTLASLEAYGNVRAVLGNNDLELSDVLDPVQEFTIEGVNVALIHDSGSGAIRDRRMYRRFPAAHVVVYGHSHIPFDVLGAYGQRLFNPGSATTRRSEPFCTYGVLRIEDGVVCEHRIERL